MIKDANYYYLVWWLNADTCVPKASLQDDNERLTAFGKVVFMNVNCLFLLPILKYTHVHSIHIVYGYMGGEMFGYKHYFTYIVSSYRPTWFTNCYY